MKINNKLNKNQILIREWIDDILKSWKITSNKLDNELQDLIEDLLFFNRTRIQNNLPIHIFMNKRLFELIRIEVFDGDINWDEIISYKTIGFVFGENKIRIFGKEYF